MMRRFPFFLYGLYLSFALAAEPRVTDVELSPQQRLEEGQRLHAKRADLERVYQQDMEICYQQFDVTSCRLRARDKRLEASAVLRKEELLFNARERRLAAEDAQRRSQEKLAQSQRDQQLAEQTSKQTSDLQVEPVARAPDSGKRAEYEQKQREAQQRRSRVEQRLRDRDKPAAASLPVPEGAK